MKHETVPYIAVGLDILACHLRSMEPIEILLCPLNTLVCHLRSMKSTDISLGSGLDTLFCHLRSMNSMDRLLSPNLIHWFAIPSELARANHHSEKSCLHLVAIGGTREPIILRNCTYENSLISLTSVTLIQGIMILLVKADILSLPLCTAQSGFPLCAS